LRPVFVASRVQHVSDMHSKFALMSHHVSNMVDIQSATAEIRREKKKIENVWNSLSSDTVDFGTLRSFKRTIKLVDFSQFLKCF